jgi:N-acetylneuraminic acid mutarotase
VWEENVANMHYRRSGASVNVYDGKIFVVGGHDGPVVHRSVEYYDPNENKWTIIAEFNVKRRNASFIIQNGLFYVMGGDDGTMNLASIEIYNPQRNIWTELPSFLNEPQSYMSSLVVKID